MSSCSSIQIRVKNKKKKSSQKKVSNQSSKVLLLPMKLENGKILPVTRTEPTNSSLVAPDNNKGSLTNQKYESENSCEFCSNKFKALITHKTISQNSMKK